MNISKEIQDFESRIFDERQAGKTLYDLSKQYEIPVRKVVQIVGDEKRRRTNDALKRAWK